MIFSNWFRRTPAIFSDDESIEVKNLCESVAENIRLLNRKATALSRDSHPRPKNLEQRLAWMKAYNEILTSQVESGNTTVREKDLMWKFFAKLRFIPTSDIFDLIKDDHYIEIYDLEGDQIYRSLNYFDIVSFTVEDVLNLNWKRHYKRNAKVNLSLLGLTARIFTGQFKRTYDCAKVPAHEVVETIASGYHFDLNIQHISPLKHQGKCVALVVVSKVRRLKPA